MNDRDAAIAFSGKWLRLRTDEELDELLDGAMAGSHAFTSVTSEINRRERECDQKRQLFWIKLTLAATVVLGVGGIVVAWMKP